MGMDGDTLDTMANPLRKRLSLFISFLLMTLVFCQGMAQAAVVASQLPQKPSPVMASCHEEMASTSQGASGCPSDCQHLDKALDSFGQVLPLDFVPVLIGFLAWPSADETVLLSRLASSPPDPASDPPLAIRLQRFRL